MEENQELYSITIDQSETIKEEHIAFSKLECIFAYVMLAVGFCFIRFVVYNVSGIFTTLFFTGIAIAFLLYLKKSNYKLLKNHIIMFALILVFSIVFIITANDFIKFLNVIFLMLCGAYFIYSVCIENNKIERFFFFSMLKAVFIIPFGSFGKAFQIMTYSKGKSKIFHNIKLILIGLVITVPLTTIITALLTRVDSGVEDVLNALFGNVIESGIILVVQFTLGIPVALYIFSMLYSNVRKAKSDVLTYEQCEKKLDSVKVFPNIVMYSAVTPITILYLLFFALQLRYFISAFQGILPHTYSYAQYARRGFFELFAISIINLMILFILSFFSKQTGENKPILLKVYSLLISFFTILIIATALSKMILYINNYGLTQLRVYTSWFMILLTISFVLIIIKQFRFNFCLERYMVISFVLLFGLLCFSNVDGMIAKYNIKMYQSGNLNNLDVESLCNLSDDALVYVLEEGIDTKNYLIGKLESYDNYPYNTYNLSSLKVKRLLEEKYK